ncbi:MAG: diguanylate cyclase [Gammaproteobacteria bacterium]|nr:diguanylate cyclase [Gammaproteobacteria bacterium]
MFKVSSLPYSNEDKQLLRFKRSQMAAFMILFFCGVTFTLYSLGFSEVRFTTIAFLISLILVGVFMILVYIRLGYNLQHIDPSLTLFQISFYMGALWVVAFTMNEHARQMIVLTSLVCYFYGSFKLKTSQLVTYACVISLSYGALLLALARYSQVVVDIPREFVAWLSLSTICFSFIAIGSESHAMRRKLWKQNEKLQQLLSQAQATAVTDELTGAFNRRHAARILKGYLELANRDKFIFSVCYIDIDYFKKINDTFGHNVGDAVLLRFAELLSENARESDTVARMGGEEFLVILPNEALDGALVYAERARMAAGQLSLDDIAQGLSITLSAGVTSYVPGDSVEEIISRADQCMYLAKKKGRNQSISSSCYNRKHIGPEGTIPHSL